VENPSEVPAGRPYFISDGSPIDNFLFLKPLCESRGRNFPYIVIPTTYMLYLAYLCETAHKVSLSLFRWHVEPFLTRAEVYKVGVTHYFSIANATRDLGYIPTISSSEGALQLAKHYAASTAQSPYFFEIASPIWFTLVLGGMIQLALVAYLDPSSAWLTSTTTSELSSSLCPSNSFCELLLQWLPTWSPMIITQTLSACRTLGILLFGSQRNLKSLFVAAVGAHVIESAMSVSVARYMKLETWPLWGLQTLLLGYPSLRILRQRLHDLSNKNRSDDKKANKN